MQNNSLSEEKQLAVGIDTSKLTAQLEATCTISASLLAEISVSSPRKLFIFIIYKKYFLDQSIQQIFYLLLKKEALCTIEATVSEDDSEELWTISASTRGG